MTVKNNQSAFDATGNSANMQFAINMAQSRKSKTILSPDNATAKFLFSILKQLDLKSIDWNQVAEEHDISNGHAARMRYSRFKTQIEGLMGISQPKARHGGPNAKGKQKENRKRKHAEFDDNNYSYSDMLYDHEESKQKFKPMTNELSNPSLNSGFVKFEHGAQIANPGSSRVKREQPAGQTTYQPRFKAEIESETPVSSHRLHENAIMPTMQSQPDLNGSIKTEAGHNVPRYQPYWQNDYNMRTSPYTRSQNQFPYPPPHRMRGGNQYPTEWGRSTYNSYPQFALNQNSDYPFINQSNTAQQAALPMSNYSNAFDLAARDSYPWPPSEASIPKYVGATYYADNTKDTFDTADAASKNNIEELPSAQEIHVANTSPAIGAPLITMPELGHGVPSIVIDDTTQPMLPSTSAEETLHTETVTSQRLPANRNSQIPEHKPAEDTKDQLVPPPTGIENINQEHGVKKEHEAIVIKLEAEDEIL